jgi:hypothetical protein
VPLAVFCLPEAGFEVVFLSQRGQVVGVRQDADGMDLQVALGLGGGFVRPFRAGGSAAELNDRPHAAPEPLT